jgi:putative hydrolase of the HAD superfamily
VSIRALVLDYGGVLSLPQDAASVGRMIEHLRTAAGPPVDGELFRRVYRHSRPAFDSGLMTGEQYWRGVAEGCGLDPADVDLAYLIARDVESWTQLNEPMVWFVHDVRPRVHRLAIISNMTPNTLVSMREHFGWLALFDECVFSCELGTNKPGREIYEHCIRRLGLRAEECLFVDDSAENVLGAREVGMAAIRFECMEQFLEGLRAFELVPSTTQRGTEEAQSFAG